MANLLQFLAAFVGGEELDHTFIPGIFVAGLGSGIQLPAETRAVADGADQQRRLLQEPVVGNQAKGSGFDVGRAVEGVHQEAEGSFIERDGHGIDCEVTAAQVLLDRSPVIHRLAWLRILHAMGADDIHPHRAGKTQVKVARELIFAPQLGVEFFQWFLELKGISVHRYFKFANGMATGEVANGVPGQKQDGAGVARHLSQLGEGVALIGREPVFQQVDIVGHALS